MRSDLRGQVLGPAQPPGALVEQLQLLLVMLLDDWRWLTLTTTVFGHSLREVDAERVFEFLV